jgi:DNA-binding transcriptional MerR regulator
MSDEHPEPFTIGQLADRTGVAVRTIRYWSDVGVLTPEGRSEGGYRLYGADAVARLELVSTLRELGLGLEEVSRIVRSEATVAEVAAAHVAALDARIRALRLSRAVLSTVAQRGSTAEETALMNRLARLSVDERRTIIEDFMREVSEGLDMAPKMAERLERSPIELPENPTTEQVDAWLRRPNSSRTRTSARACAECSN